METVFFVVSKLAWAAIRPESLLMLGLAASWLWARRRPRLSRVLTALVLLSMIGIAAWPVQNYVLAPLEAAYPQPASPPLRVNGILVLGGAELSELTARHGPPQVNAAAERLSEAVVQARRFPAAPVIFTGGNNDLRGGPSGAGAAGRYMTDLGLPPARLILEDRSRTTAENARLTLDRVRPQPGQRWLLITSGFHMRRAVESFCAAGWTGIVPWPTDFRVTDAALEWDPAENMMELGLGLREWIGLWGYRWTGRARTPDATCLAPG